jgi:hypothetical protein
MIFVIRKITCHEKQIKLYSKNKVGWKIRGLTHKKKKKGNGSLLPIYVNVITPILNPTDARPQRRNKCTLEERKKYVLLI